MFHWTVTTTLCREVFPFLGGSQPGSSRGGSEGVSEEFFRLENFLRSLLVGMVQGLALSVGYSYAPAIATQLRLWEAGVGDHFGEMNHVVIMLEHEH